MLLPHVVFDFSGQIIRCILRARERRRNASKQAAKLLISLDGIMPSTSVQRVAQIDTDGNSIWSFGTMVRRTNRLRINSNNRNFSCSIRLPVD